MVITPTLPKPDDDIHEKTMKVLKLTFKDYKSSNPLLLRARMPYKDFTKSHSDFREYLNRFFTKVKNPEVEDITFLINDEYYEEKTFFRIAYEGFVRTHSESSPALAYKDELLDEFEWYLVGKLFAFAWNND